VKRGIAVAAALLALGVPAHAAGADATAAEVRELARLAQNDAGAAQRLRRIDRVDGRPADLERALRGAENAGELDARLRALAELQPSSRPVARAARADAQEILAQRRFRGSDVPRPFRRPLRWVGGKLDAVFGPVGRAIDALPEWLAIALGLAVAVVAAAGVVGVVRSRSARSVERHEAAHVVRDEDPRRLEQLADEAERRGELERALRLRFRAGLVRLARAKAIPSRASLTTGQILRLLRVPEFERIARTFDEVVYGGRPARPEDVETARTTWPRVVAAARRP
jgi:hypothetical protein